MKDAVKEKKSKKKDGFKQNKKENRYELDLGNDSLAIITYREMPWGDIALTYTKVPADFEGQGVGSELVQCCLEDIQDKGVKVIPQCGFVASYIRKNPEWTEIVSRKF